jgi:subfamily B ATP-binding cassette protein MsbA
VAYAIRASMDVITVYCLNWVGRSAIYDLRAQLFNQFLRLPTRFFDAGSTGELLSKLTYNTEQVAEAISNAIVVAIRDTLTIIVVIGVMIYLSWHLTLLVAIVAPTVGMLVAYLSRAFRKYSGRIQNSMGDVTRIAEQSLLGQRVVKVFQGEELESETFEATNRQNFKLNVRLVATRALGDALTQYIIALGMAAIIYVSFTDWLSSAITPGVFMGFITAMGMLLAPLKRLININVAVQRGIAAASSIFEVLDTEIERDTGSKTCARAKGRVAYERVSFAYDSAKGRVLHEIDLTIEAGMTVALVGRSGSGKSSLVSLLPRFYDVDAGRVTLDGIDIRDYRLLDLRRQIALVSQDVVLFDDTIANNIAYGALRRASRGEIERAAEAAHVLEFARDLPQGLDSEVGERGALLSGGQRQRIAIARALLKDAPVLILDEATSSLDTESERKIQDAVDHLIRNRTTLIVAHRLSTIEKADRIVVLEDGAIVESGTHAELLEARGFYAALYKMQFAD